MESQDDAWKDLHGLRQDFDELKDSVEQLIEIKGLGQTNSSASTVTLGMGGIGVWIACTCAAVCMVASLFLGVLFLDHSRKIDSLQDYIAAIYAQAPQLRPTENKEGKD